ncbi:Amino Acid/Auxin Permease (AAAP) Family [Thraustotheca clavata]|uniref:Amino Acid/Auxin Permease (AAAP) Family n=1 Tax=Thraustotheca clavata TaxID=74557 RepID=A0A1W0A4Z5_9STRA|nr:Amino Acid/Auxin Permease (AAAP) Family [Thraustotheca clavata]
MAFIEWYMPQRFDVGVVIQLICCLCGIGSLSMPYIFAQSGATFSGITFGLNFLFNTYATVALCQCLLKLKNEPQVQSYVDLGQYLYGRWGAIVVQATQLASCFLLPIAFLVLGGSTLLPSIFEGAIDISSTWWIIIMTIVLLPIIYIRVLHEAYIVLIAGALGTIVADVIATIDAYMLSTGDIFEATNNPGFTDALNTFGAFALAYGAATIVPQMQNHHPRPESMPSTIVYGMILISIFYVALGAVGYAHFGCAAPSNLLIAMSTKTPRRRISFCFMQMHITIALAIFMNPFFVYFERMWDPLFTKKQPTEDIAAKAEEGFVALATPKDDSTVDPITEPEPQKDVSGRVAFVRRIIFRTSMVALQCFLALLAQSSFSDIADLIGASVMNLCSVILPLIFYMRMFRQEMSKFHQVICVGVIIITSLMGIYSTYHAIANIIDNSSTYKLFSSVPSVYDPKSFPYCPAGFETRKADWINSLHN